MYNVRHELSLRQTRPKGDQMGLDYLCYHYYPKYGVCVLWRCWTGVVTTKEKRRQALFFSLYFDTLERLRMIQIRIQLLATVRVPCSRNRRRAKAADSELNSE